MVACVLGAEWATVMIFNQAEKNGGVVFARLVSTRTQQTGQAVLSARRVGFLTRVGLLCVVNVGGADTWARRELKLAHCVAQVNSTQTPVRVYARAPALLGVSQLILRPHLRVNA